MKRQIGLVESVRRRTARASRRAVRGAWGLWAWSSEGDLRSVERRGRKTRAERRSKRERRGSTLLVVLGLLGMLSLLGLIYFSFANQELQNANYFADRSPPPSEDDIERIFSAAMKQIILGAETSQPNSVMWGRRHSMLFNLIGFDVQPHSGTGVNLALDGGGGLIVDQDHDGTADSQPAGYDLLNVNDSPAAQGLFQRNILALPAPDVDYTYPDHNNLFLGYKGYTWDYRLTPPAPRLVIKPSFHRPELLRNGSGLPVANWATANGAGGRLFRPHPEHLYVWRQNTTAAPQRRFIIDAASNPAANPTLAGYVTADAGLIGPSPTTQVRAGFPFLVNLNDPNTGTPDGNYSEQGVFSAVAGPGGSIVNLGAWNQYEYDVDNDGDGVPDSIWMDFDLAVLVRPSDGRNYVPLISASIYDLDSLLDANMVGNTFGNTRTNATSNFGNGGPISVSAQGLSSPAEINPLYALDAVYSEASAEAQADLAAYFGHAPANALEMANMEYWLSLKGHVRYSTPQQIHAGRFGEANRMWNVLQQGGAPISVHANTGTSNLFPFPGLWDVDDNRDANEGTRTWNGGAMLSDTVVFRHPLALGGRGRFWSGPKQMSLYSVPTNPVSFMAYNNMFTGFDALNSNSQLVGVPQWYGLDPFGVGGSPMMTNTLLGANFGVPNTGAPFPNPATPNDYTLVDDSMEVTTDPKYLLRPYDEPFEALDTLYLQMSTLDRQATGLASRLADTMPGNLVVPTGAAAPHQLEVAQRFTTISSALKHFGLPRVSGPGPDGQPGIAGEDDNQNGLVDEPAELGYPGSDDDRAWEFNVDVDRDGLPEFPPQFNPASDFQPLIDPSGSDYRPENAYGPRDPFRPQLRRLLSAEFGSTGSVQNPKRLSINEFLDIERSPNATPNVYTSPLQYRQLTPHSTDSTLTTLPTPTPVTVNQAYQEPYTLPNFPPTTEAEKEFWARRDRQQMARDIYVLLYTFCGGNDSVSVTTPAGTTITTTGNLTTNSGFEVHPGNVRRQMAQFAVNLVDALDTDNVITAFEFDHNLLNGWNLDDDPATPDTMPSGDARDVVYGVETPQLTFSEAAWYRQQQQGSDNPQTPYNDTVGEFNFVQLELRSIFPETVQLANPLSSTPSTGIWRIVRDDNNNGLLDLPDENAVVFLNTAGSIAPGGLFTIASSDSGSLGSAGLESSLIYIDTTGGTDFEMVCPNKTAPAYMSGTQPGSNIVTLDLLHPNDNNKFALATGNPGDFLSRNNSPTMNTNPVPAYFTDDTAHTVFSLQRRLNPRLPQLSLTVNPFVPVDAFDRDGRTAAGKIGVQRMDLAFDGTITDQATALARVQHDDLRSTERGQPLKNIKIAPDTDDLALSGNVTPGMMKTTFTANNSNSPAQFNERYLFLPHFDRDFSSVVELFHIPLFGPREVTRDASMMWLAPEFSSGGADLGQLGATMDPNALAPTYIGPLSFGAAVFLQSENRDGVAGLSASEDTNGNGLLDTPPSEDTNGNGWLDYGEDLNNNGVLDSHPYHFHRFLGFAEVPTRAHRQLGNPLQVHREPGKLNLNGIRDPRVLAALIDDLQVHGIPERDLNGNGYTEDKNLNDVLDAGEDLNGNGTLDIIPPDANEDLNSNGRWDRGLQDITGTDPGRDWWTDFLLARDGFDTTSNLLLPLGGTSRPFRDLGLTATSRLDTNQSLEDTILRRFPTATPPDSRRLFELSTEAEFKRDEDKNGNGVFDANNPLEDLNSNGIFDPATEDSNGNGVFDRVSGPLMQHRLLSKVIGNTTTRSNCFVVFVTIGMFECVDVTPAGTTETVTRIGAPLLDATGTTPVTYRKAYIVDRSTALEAYDRASGTFDWKKLIMAQQRIQ